MIKQTKALLFALVAIFFWSTVAVPFKLGLQDFHYLHFLFITITIAVVVSFLAILGQGKLGALKNVTKKQWIRGIAGGFLNPFLYYLMLFKAYAILPAQIAQALNYTWPIMLVILSVPFLGQKLNLKSLGSLFIGFLGVYLIASEGSPWPLQPSNPWGVVLAISTSLVWAIYWLINTKSDIDAILNLFINFSTGWLLTLPLALMVSHTYLVSTKSWLAVIYAGIFEMGLTFVIWLTAMRLTSRTDKISNYVFLSPFLSLIFIRLFLHETIYITTVVGLVCIVISVFFKIIIKSEKNQHI